MGRLEEAIRILASELQSADGRRRIEELLTTETPVPRVRKSKSTPKRTSRKK